MDDQLLRTSTKVAIELQQYGAPAEIIRLQKSFQSALEGVAFTYGSALLLEHLVTANGAMEGVAGVALSHDFPIEATSIVSFDSIISNIRTGAYITETRRDLIIRVVAAVEDAFTGLRIFSGMTPVKGDVDRNGSKARGEILRAAAQLAKHYALEFHFEMGDRELVDNLVITRNDLTHNAGIASERYAACTQSFFGRRSRGDKICIPHNAIDDVISFIDSAVGPAFALVAFASMNRRDLTAGWGNP